MCKFGNILVGVYILDQNFKTIRDHSAALSKTLEDQNAVLVQTLKDNNAALSKPLEDQNARFSGNYNK